MSRRTAPPQITRSQLESAPSHWSQVAGRSPLHWSRGPSPVIHSATAPGSPPLELPEPSELLEEPPEPPLPSSSAVPESSPASVPQARVMRSTHRNSPTLPIGPELPWSPGLIKRAVRMAPYGLFGLESRVRTLPVPRFSCNEQQGPRRSDQRLRPPAREVLRQLVLPMSEAPLRPVPRACRSSTERSRNPSPELIPPEEIGSRRLVAGHGLTLDSRELSVGHRGVFTSRASETRRDRKACTKSAFGVRIDGCHTVVAFA